MDVAQLAERLPVEEKVAGAEPVIHPKVKLVMSEVKSIPHTIQEIPLPRLQDRTGLNWHELLQLNLYPSKQLH